MATTECLSKVRLNKKYATKYAKLDIPIQQTSA